MKKAKNTVEELNKYDEIAEYDHDTLVRLVISYQNQLISNHKDIEKLKKQNEKLLKQVDEQNEKLQKILEQVVLSNRKRFGRSSEKTETEGQLSFEEIDGVINIFNQAEHYFDENKDIPEDYIDEDETGTRAKKSKKKPSEYPRKKDIDSLPHEITEYTMSEDELKAVFADERYKELPVQKQYEYKFVPARVKILEKQIHVYAGAESERIVRADHPKKLFNNSLASANMVAASMTAKYLNAVPYERQHKDFASYGADISTQDLSAWTIKASERYLSLAWNHMKKRMLESCRVIQADETFCQVNKDGRAAGAKSSMWVYLSGEFEKDIKIVLYEYQKTREQKHPREFLKDYRGICVTDGYQVYHNIEKEIEELKIAGCFAHARRKFYEAKEAAEGRKEKTIAHDALKMIQAISGEDKKLKELSGEERKKQRGLVVRPLVEAYFEYIHKYENAKISSEKTRNAITYSINQEKYLRVFLDEPDVPMDNNAAERAIRPFTVGRKNWVMIDTISGAQASAVVYSIVETAKANGLKVYDYLEYLLREIPEHMEETDQDFLEDLMPWSDKLPEGCRRTKGTSAK